MSGPEPGTYAWWYQVLTEEVLYGYSETLIASYASQGITIHYGKPTEPQDS